MIKKFLLLLLLSFSLITSAFAEAIDANTLLLLHCNGADASTTFTDASPSAHGNASVAGTAQVDTADFKFPTGSLLLDGNSDYIYYADHADWYFGTGNFTVDFWYKQAGGDATNRTFFGQRLLTTYWAVTIEDNNCLRMKYVNGGVVKGDYITTSAVSINDSAWHHIAFVRNGAVGLIFLDGVSQTLTENTAFGTNDVGNSTGSLGIGAYLIDTAPESFLNGWVDEIRISNVARWTADFTPPANEYGFTPASGQVIFIE